MTRNIISVRKVQSQPWLIARHRALLGEGARWCSRKGVLYWVDILGLMLHEFDPHTGRERRWPVPKQIGCSAALSPERRLLALKDGLYDLDLESGQVSILQKISHPTTGHRFNDGAVDPLGRFWVGSLDEAGGFGQLFCFDDPVSAPRLFGESWGCLNGIGWSPDGRVMYVTDSRERVIWSFDYDIADGRPSHQRVFAKFPDAVPDGICVDVEGALWVALWDGSAVVRLDQRGAVLQRLSLPVRRPTSVALGGASGRSLFITSASVNVPVCGDPEDALDGSIFMAAVDVPGAAESAVLLSNKNS